LRRLSGLLTDDPGGKRLIVADTDDYLLQTPYCAIPREGEWISNISSIVVNVMNVTFKDVAEVLLQSLIWPEAIGRSIDIGSHPEGKSPQPMDWRNFWNSVDNCAYPADLDPWNDHN
jgi:hypothetical protein